MWPFSSNKKPLPVPEIIVGDISIRWDPEFHWWEFSDDEYDFSLSDNTQFDVAILDRLEEAKRWIGLLNDEIDSKIRNHLDGWCEWNGEKHVVGIDVSRLLTEQSIDVTYAGNDDWGDLGVNIVITNGKITNSYAGD